MKHTLIVTLTWITVLYILTVFLPQNFFSDYTYEKDVIFRDHPIFLWHLANFDGAHYQNIAGLSYITGFQTAFFPLYPLVTSLISRLLGNHLISSLFISFVSTLISAIIVFRLSRRLSAVILTLAFPTAFFLIAGYTESFFLALSLSAYYATRQKHYLSAGVIGLLAAATRFYGLLLLPTLLITALFGLPRSKRKCLSTFVPLLPLFLIPLGLFAYMYYLNVHFHDPIKFFHALDLWQKSKTTFPLVTLYRYAKIFILVSPSLFQYKIALLEFAFFMLGLAGAVYSARHRLYDSAFYLLVATIIPACTGTLQSVPRYLLVVFPLLFVEAKFSPPVYRFFVIFGFILQLVLFYYFLSANFIA